jgi:hypothetical protein
VRGAGRDSLLFALAAGAVLGVATRLVYQLPHEWWWLAKVGVPWLAAAFAVGALARGARRGSLHGAAALVSATLVYYAILALVQHAYGVSAVGLGWLPAAVVGGAAFGALGWLWKSGRAPVLAISILAASFAGEALLFGLLVRHHGRAGSWLFAVALAVPFVMLRARAQRARATVLAASLALAALALEGGVFVVTRYVG